MTHTELQAKQLQARYRLEELKMWLNDVERTLFHYSDPDGDNRRIQVDLARKYRVAENKLRELDRVVPTTRWDDFLEEVAPC